MIHNPVAGPKVVNRIDRVRSYLSARGLPFRIRETAAPGDAVVMAREAAFEGADAVVAVGGDGTMKVAGSATRLAFVPHGTGNVFAREFSLPESVEACLDLLSSGKTISVRMAKANDRRFVLLASAGFDAEVVERMTPRQKNLFGIAAYVLCGARHLLRSQPTLWLEFPGRERIEAQAVIVARGKKYGGNVTIAPAGDIAGETFQVIALLRKGRWQIAKFALDALRGIHTASRHVLVRESPSLFVRSTIPSACQVDGEYVGPLPVRFTVTDALLRIVVPAEFPFPGDPPDRCEETFKGLGKDLWQSQAGGDRFLQRERDSWK
ncbi:MAG TPA: diacylglycerol kinase family lipid kinase [Thermodesulfobacteriota bacterium]|nr:diacylglycerol kinase family lipid kinase [Thermodesulfobacteriota bacterium]